VLLHGEALEWDAMLRGEAPGRVAEDEERADRDRLGVALAQVGERAAHGGACGDHVVHDDDAPPADSVPQRAGEPVLDREHAAAAGRDPLGVRELRPEFRRDRQRDEGALD
jgi:hypothetical protein